MATKQPLQEPVFDSELNDVAWTVDVMQRVGVVTYADNGDFPPLKVAFMMASDHFAKNATNKTQTFEYIFNAPVNKINQTGHTIKVTVEG